MLHACRPTAVNKLANFYARLPGKAAWQGVHAMVQYAESMVKLGNNALF
jgi:hypothetical protein